MHFCWDVCSALLPQSHYVKSCWDFSVQTAINEIQWTKSTAEWKFRLISKVNPKIDKLRNFPHRTLRGNLDTKQQQHQIPREKITDNAQMKPYRVINGGCLSYIKHLNGSHHTFGQLTFPSDPLMKSKFNAWVVLNVSLSGLEKCSIASLSQQWMLCSEWVPSEWESKQLIKTSQ